MQFSVLIPVFVISILVAAESAAIGKNGKKGKQITVEEINQNVKSKDVEDALAAARVVGGKKYSGISRAEIQQMKKTAAKIRRTIARKLKRPEPDTEFAESVLFGDVVFNQDQLEEILVNLEKSPGGRRKRQFRTGSQFPSSVPYVFDSSLSIAAQAAVNNAIARFETQTCVNFLYDATPSGNWIFFTSSASGCFSYVGRQNGATQLNLGSGCETTGTAIHEMMHALGFYHEQSRRDRDAYVTVVLTNIQSGTEYNFAIATTADLIGQGVYDFRSIMHYSAFAFSSNGQRTIETVDPANQNLIDIPNRADMSSSDIQGIRTKYGCSGTTFTAATETTTEPPTSQKVYQRYSSVARDHFYTTSYKEGQQVLTNGYRDDGTLGTGWTIAANCTTLTPMYRMYNPSAADHFYTTNENEMQQAKIRYGYAFENIAFYCVPSQSNDCGATVPVHRYWSSAAKDHFYVGSKGTFSGYKYEGIQCYVAP